MSELISEVSRLLERRRVTHERELVAARRTYSDSLVMDAGPPEAAQALIAAMDRLELDAADLATDYEVVRAGRQLETEVAAYERELDRAKAASADLERELSGADRPGDRRIDAARARLSEAAAVRMKYELLISILEPQVISATARAPRVFGGAPRRLAVPTRERTGTALGGLSKDATGSDDAAALLAASPSRADDKVLGKPASLHAESGAR